MKKFLKSAMSVVLGILMASGVLLQGFSQQALIRAYRLTRCQCGDA